MKAKRAFRVWQRHFTVYTKLYKSSIALNFVEPVLYLAAMGLGLGALVQEINGRPYVNFIAPGIIASSSMFASIYECTYGTYVRMTFQKTFDAMFVALRSRCRTPRWSWVRCCCLERYDPAANGAHATRNRDDATP